MHPPDRSGVDLLEVQRILGHQSILTTIRYTHLTDHTKDNAADRINALIGQISIGWGNVMIRLAHIVDNYAAELIAQHGHRLLPSQLAALSAFRICRSSMSHKIQLACDDCQEQSICRLCGHRHCPHCQAPSRNADRPAVAKADSGNYFW